MTGMPGRRAMLDAPAQRLSPGGYLSRSAAFVSAA
jgi:hypothetical protein